MENVLTGANLDKVKDLFTDVVTWVAKIIYSMVATMVDLITTPAILSILVSIAIIYALYRWFRSKTPGL